MGCPSLVELGSNLVFSVCTHDPTTGVLTDADSVPSYRIYEEETGTAHSTGSMAKLDDANTTGFYTELLAVTTGNSFEINKTYSVYVTAAVGTDTGGMAYSFQVIAPVATAATTDEILVDTATTIPGTLTSITGILATIDGIVDSILVDTGTTLNTTVNSILQDTETTIPNTLTNLSGDIGNVPTNAELATALAASLDTAIPGSPTADSINDRIKNMDTKMDGVWLGTFSGTPSTTSGESDLSGFAEDSLNSRWIYVLDGAAKGEAKPLTDYTTTLGTLTWAPAMAATPSSGDKFMIA